jgi:hypothetical protein
MGRQDSVVWREPSGRARSWTITPKDTTDWLFEQRAFAGSQESPAVTPRPRPDALENHPYAYRVSIVCADGTTQDVDPDIIIGEAQQF